MKGSAKLFDEKSGISRYFDGFHIPLFLFLVVLLGGATNLSVQAVVLVVVGVLLLVSPPQSTPSRLIDWLLLVLVLSGFVSFLPHDWLGGSFWRDLAVDRFGLEVSPTHSPQVLLSSEAMVLLLLGVGWFYLCCCQRVTHQSRKGMLLIFVGLVGVLGLISIAGNYYDFKHPFSQEAWNFSFFPNKNQSSNFFCMGGIVSCVLAIYQLKRQRYDKMFFLSLGVTCVLFLALSYGLSRAGVFFFFLGVLIWSLLNHDIVKKVDYFKFFLPIFLICVGFLFLTKGETLFRVIDLTQSPLGRDNYFRLHVYNDTWQLIKDHWIKGIGLGNFQYIFPFYRDSTYMYGNLIHPESDWLWVWVEFGFIGFLALILIVGVILLSLRGFGSFITKPYKAAAFSALIIFVLHSLLDVPGHRIGTVFTAIFLYSLAHSASANQKCLFPPSLFRALGLILVAVGLIWIVGVARGYPVQTRIVKDIYKEDLSKKLKDSTYDSIIKELGLGIKYLPLDYKWYYRLGVTRLAYRRDISEAVLDFRRVRFLSPIDGHVVLNEGHMWLGIDPERAFGAYQEALSRINFAPREASTHILEKASNVPGTEPLMRRLADQNNDFLIVWLLRASNDDVGGVLRKKTKEGFDLKGLDYRTRKSLLEKWASSIEASYLTAYLKENDLGLEGVFFQAWALAHMGKLEEATRLLIEKAPPEPIPVFESALQRSMQDLERNLLLSPGDIVSGSELLRRQVEEEKWENALDTVSVLIESSTQLPYLYYWAGVIYYKQGRYYQSWESCKQYVELKEL